MKKKKFLFLVGGILVFSLILNNTKNNQISEEIKVRQVAVENIDNKYKLEKAYENYDLSSNNNFVEFNGTTIKNENTNSFIDEVSYFDVSKDSDIEIKCQFDMLNTIFLLDIGAYDTCGNFSHQIVETPAIITETGGLDAFVELDENNNFYLSDYANESSLNECFWWVIAILVIIVVYVVVAEIAEQVKARENYDYNKNLEATNNGVGYGCYITDQTKTNRYNYKSGNYHFGFAEFKNVGCEVASLYNLMISLGRTQRLSQTIYDVETLCIEFSIGWGHLGSNPYDAYRFLDKYNIRYETPGSYYKFKKVVENTNSCKIIMANWNKRTIDGMHAYFVEKNNNKFITYNLICYDFPYTRYKTIDEIINESGDFIVGYIIKV